MKKQFLNLFIAILIDVLLIRIGFKIWWAWEYWLLVLAFVCLFLNNRK